MLDLAKDRRRCRRPDERAGMLVVFAHVGTNGGEEGGHAAEGATPDPFSRDLSKETLDEIQPRGPRGREVEMKPRMVDHPGLHSRMLVRAVVVQDEMDVPPGRRLPSDLVQEGEEF